MKPDYDRAATKAMETLITNGIRTAPVSPIPIIKKLPHVVVLSFADMSTMTMIERSNLIAMCGENMDAVTFCVPEGQLRYIVAYNQMLPFYLIQRALARELGHIVLQHDGTRPEDVRMAEAYCFAHHLLCPRPVLHALREAGIDITVEMLGSITGCYERCLAAIRNEPPACVPVELNRLVRDQFADYLKNYIAFQQVLSKNDTSALADFGCYMEGYEE